MTEFDFTTQVTKTLQINRKEQNQNAETLSRLLDSRFRANETLKNINIELLVSVGGSTSRLRSTSSERSEVALSSVLVARKLLPSVKVTSSSTTLKLPLRLVALKKLFNTYPNIPRFMYGRTTRILSQYVKGLKIFFVDVF